LQRYTTQLPSQFYIKKTPLSHFLRTPPQNTSMMIEKKKGGGGSHSVNLHGGAMAATCVFPLRYPTFLFPCFTHTHTKVAKVQKRRSRSAAARRRKGKREKKASNRAYGCRLASWADHLFIFTVKAGWMGGWVDEFHGSHKMGFGGAEEKEKKEKKKCGVCLCVCGSICTSLTFFFPFFLP